MDASGVYMARHVSSPRWLPLWIHQLERLARLGVPLYVTENGTFDRDDARRPGFLIDHVSALVDAVAGGLDVRGYFVWSLVDNFEWAEGWTTPFGLLALDRDTQRRTPRGSADVYAAICRANGIPGELAPTVRA